MPSIAYSSLHLQTLLPSSVFFTSPSLSPPRPSLQWAKPFRPSPRAPPLSFSTHRCLLPHACNLPEGNSGETQKGLSFDRIIDTALNVLDDLPQPIRNFPWGKASESFFRLFFHLTGSVCKYLSVPVLALSSLSEMSYCAHENKLLLVPFPFLIGLLLANVLAETGTELLVGVKDGEFPWHLLLVAVFFLMLKLPGPYYPFWARLLVPHFANGGLWRMIWLVFAWNGRAGRTIL